MLYSSMAPNEPGVPTGMWLPTTFPGVMRYQTAERCRAKKKPVLPQGKPC